MIMVNHWMTKTMVLVSSKVSESPTAAIRRTLNREMDLMNVPSLCRKIKSIVKEPRIVCSNKDTNKPSTSAP